MDARVPIGIHAAHYRAMRQDWADIRVHPRDKPLSLAQRITVQYAGPAPRDITAPPIVYLLEDFCLRLPTVYREPEGGLRDEGVAGHQLKGFAGGIALNL